MEPRSAPPDVPTGRASDLQLQVDQVSVALRHLRQSQDGLVEMERRLAQLTSDCASILERWAKNDEQHASAVVELHSRLAEWNDLERKLLGESAARVHQFERSLQHEWQALRQKHEEPLLHLETETTRITETCLQAVDTAVRTLDRAEARLAATEQELHRQMEDLAREVREALTELRRGALPPGPQRPWALEDVVRVHSEYRTGEPTRPEAGPPGVVESSVATPAVAPAPDPPVELTPAVRPDLFGTDATTPPTTSAWRSWRSWAVAGLVVALVTAAAYGVALLNRMEAGLRQATSRADDAERRTVEARAEAAREVTEVRETALRDVTVARDAARSAQAVAMILASPDLVRLELVPRARAAGATGQVLWSRSTGAAITVSGLPAPPAGQAYHAWLLLASGPLKLARLAIDASGRASLVLDPEPSAPRVIGGVRVTLEPDDDAVAPAGPTFLAGLAQAPSVAVP